MTAPPLFSSPALPLLGASPWNFPLFPPAASDYAADVDLLYWALVFTSVVMTVVISALVVFFAVKYRVGSKADRRNPITETHKHELVWIGGTTIILLGLFAWATTVYFYQQRVPPDTLDIYVVGKQWMWKTQHPSGRREINELHLPKGQAVKLTITSQDVLHSFYIPAFRSKMDAVPGRFTSSWFRPILTGEFHLFCAEYCGAEHSRMVGRVVVMEPQDYQEWLATGNREESMASAGGGPFATLGCNQCHVPGNPGRAPDLVGAFGSQVKLADGRSVVVNEEYIRESIVDPQAKVVAGYTPLMPSFRSQVDGETLGQLVEYIKSLSTPKSPGGPGSDSGSPGAGTAAGAAPVNPGGAASAPARGNGSGGERGADGAGATSGGGSAPRAPGSIGERGDSSQGQPTEAASKLPKTGDTPR